MEQLISKKDVANLLKDARAQCRMSVEEVAAALKSYGYEIVPKSMYNYENGVSQPPVSMFLALCRIYGIEDVIAAVKDGYTRTLTVTAQEEQLVERFRRASPELQRAALRVLQPAEGEQP